MRLARRSLCLLACPQFLVALVAFGGMGTVWGYVCVLWCVGGTGGHGKNDDITILLTNAGAKQDGLFMPF